MSKTWRKSITGETQQDFSFQGEALNVPIAFFFLWSFVRFKKNYAIFKKKIA